MTEHKFALRGVFMGHQTLYNKNQIRGHLFCFSFYLEVVPMSTDLLYYIMDYSGNYYRVNKADQLVAAREEEATVFTFAQANSRICIGKKSSFYCMIPIEEKEADEKNRETLKEGMSETKENKVIEQEEEREYISPVKELTYDELQEPIEKKVYSYDLSQLDWVEYLTHFAYVACGIKDYRDQLAKKHSDIEKKICDILHYIELCETDDEEAIDLVELLRVCRENRRDTKDELMRIEFFQTNLGTSANVAKAKQALKSIKGLGKRKYKPRKYDELFENCIMNDRHRVKADMNVGDSKVENKQNKSCAVRAVKDKDEGGEDIMTEEKIFTPYDGKENDWLSFARQQAEFYRNASQYIANLEITMIEIDQEIEGILQETEDANCNVTQGYKVFKKLKELRLERKAKAQELKCLYALTDRVDCDLLADTYESNLNKMEEVMNEKEESVMNAQIASKGSEQIRVVEMVQDMVG